MAQQDSQFEHPLLWSESELERDRRAAIGLFASSLMDSGTAAYNDWWMRLRPVVNNLLCKTGYLTDLHDNISSLTDNESCALRFTTAPHISEDNLKTLVNTLIASGTCSKDNAFAEVILSMLDPFRFPWLSDGRTPTRHERESAINWTTGVWAAQKLQTQRRNDASHNQENAVYELLKSQGYQEVSLSNVRLISDMEIGTFSSETPIANQKCDVPVRLKDGRLLLIECKVSNSTTNSTKRLIREVCGKVPVWKEAFGKQMLVAAVLDGVISNKNLNDAQNEHGVFLFWSMRLEDLAIFLERCSVE